MMKRPDSVPLRGLCIITYLIVKLLCFQGELVIIIYPHTSVEYFVLLIIPTQMYFRQTIVARHSTSQRFQIIIQTRINYIYLIWTRMWYTTLSILFSHNMLKYVGFNFSISTFWGICRSTIEMFLGNLEICKRVTSQRGCGRMLDSVLFYLPSLQEQGHSISCIIVVLSQRTFK